MNRYTRFLLLFAVSALATAAAVGLFNATIDANGIYAGGTSPALQSYVETYVTRAMASERGFAPTRYERAVKLELLRRVEADCYLAGSSREMPITREVFPAAAKLGCDRLLNLSVSGGSFEDFIISADAVFAQRGARALFVAVPPWFLRANADVRWSENPAMLRAARSRLGLPMPVEPHLAKIINLFSAHYLMHNIAYRLAGAGRFDIAEARPGEEAFHADGSIVHSREDETTQPAGRSDGGFRIRQPFVDPVVVGELAKVLTLLQSRGLKLVILLTPYRPRVLGCHRVVVCEALQSVEQEIRRLAARQGVQIIGGYDPRPFNLDDSDFVDDVHPRVRAFPKIATFAQP